jgi:hypothetical protein
VPRIGEIKSGRMRWTVQAVCMENKQDIKHCIFKTSRKYTTLLTPGYKQGEKQLVGWSSGRFL